MKLLYTNAFGEPYISMAKLCIESVVKLNEPDLRLFIITDNKQAFDLFKNNHYIKLIQIDEQLSVCDKMAFRTRIKDYIDISKYDQVWFCDPDIIFKRNPFHLFDGTTDIKVCREIWTTLQGYREWFAKDIPDELMQVIGGENGINGGFWMVPKEQYNFFLKYLYITTEFNNKYPNNISADQQALNTLFYCNIEHYLSTIPITVVCFPAKFDYNNHYIMHFACMHNDEKLMKMQAFV